MGVRQAAEGCPLPFLFAALTMISVGKAAAEIITEVRRQFVEHTNKSGFTLGQCIRLYTEKYEKMGEGNWSPEEQAETTQRAPAKHKSEENSTYHISQ